MELENGLGIGLSMGLRLAWAQHRNWAEHALGNEINSCIREKKIKKSVLGGHEKRNL